MEPEVKARIENALRQAQSVTVNTRVYRLVSKALNSLDLNRKVAKELAQMALAEAFNSDSGVPLALLLSKEDQLLCFEFVKEWMKKEAVLAVSWKNYVASGRADEAFKQIPQQPNKSHYPMSPQHLALIPYRREIIGLLNDEKTPQQIATYLNQQYSINVSEQDIRDLIRNESK